MLNYDMYLVTPSSLCFRKSQSEPIVYCLFDFGEIHAVNNSGGNLMSFQKVRNPFQYLISLLFMVQLRRNQRGSQRPWYFIRKYLICLAYINRSIYFNISQQRMNQALREINVQQNRPLPKPKQKPKPIILKPRYHIRQLLATSVDNLDFGECLVQSIYSKKLSIILKEAQKEPKLITIAITYENKAFQDFPEYVFGIKRQSASQYFDEFKFKAAQKGIYNFDVGVKTPILDNIDINLSQKTKIPSVTCQKELVDEEGHRVIKICAIKSKNKRQTKVIFKCQQDIVLISQLCGLSSNENYVEVRPRMLQTGNKGFFVLSFSPQCNDNEENKIIRKILIMKIKDTNIHYHFPLEITLQGGNKRGESID